MGQIGYYAHRANQSIEEAMIYQHRFLHVFMCLFFFYVLICLMSVSIYLLITARALYFEIMTNPYVWMLYAPGPLFVGMSVSLFFAGIIRWMYRCKMDGDNIVAKDTWGREIVIDPKDITSVQSYNVPFMPLSRLKLSNAKWSAWVPKSAALNIGLTEHIR